MVLKGKEKFFDFFKKFLKGPSKPFKKERGFFFFFWDRVFFLGFKSSPAFAPKKGAKNQPKKKKKGKVKPKPKKRKPAPFLNFTQKKKNVFNWGAPWAP